MLLKFAFFFFLIDFVFLFFNFIFHSGSSELMLSFFGFRLFLGNVWLNQLSLSIDYVKEKKKEKKRSFTLHQNVFLFLFESGTFSKERRQSVMLRSYF